MKITKIIKGLFFFIIICILCALCAIGAYMTYVNTNAEEAKKYLLDKYEINKKDLTAIKYTKYVYEDIANCESLWLKKCTSDKELLYTYTFKTKNKETIVVKEDLNGNLSDDYNGILKEKDVEDKTEVTNGDLRESN